MKVIKSGMFVMWVFAVIKLFRLIRKKFYSFLETTLKIFQKKKNPYLIKKILIGQTSLIKTNCGLFLFLSVEIS